MKKKPFILALAAVLAAALAVTGLAADDYAVADADDWTAAIAEIGEAGGEAVIKLTGNVDIGAAPVGVEGADITVTSDGGTFLLTTDGDELHLAGNVTFEDVHVSAKTIYAEGHELVLGEGFGGGNDGQQRMIVYGGSDNDLDADTHVEVYSGVYKLIAGGNSAGTLTGDTYVKFGGDARFPTAADGKLTGDTATGSSAGYNLYQAAEYESSFNPVMVSYIKRGHIPYGIYGGGIDADTTGSTKVEMTGGEVYQIFGGGAATWNPKEADEKYENGTVGGNTTVHVTGGKVKSIYGGGYNGVDAYRNEPNRTAPEESRSTRAVVSGTAYVTIEGDAVVPACEQSEDASSAGADPAKVHGGSFHSTVKATVVVVGGNATLESGGKATTGYGYGSLYGAGTNDIVLTTTSVTLRDNARVGSDSNNLRDDTMISQGEFGNITPLGFAEDSYIGGVKFSYGSEIKNKEKVDYAATVTIEGGQVDVVGVGCKSRNTSQASKKVDGNVLIQQTGGTIMGIEAGCINEKNVTVTGNVDVKISGGTVEHYINGKYDSSHVEDEVIDGSATLELLGAAADGGYRVTPLIEHFDKVTIKSGAKIAVEGDWTVNDYEGKYGITNPKPNYMNAVTGIPFFQVEELVVEEGAALALSQKHALIEGDITINGQLGLARYDGIYAGIGKYVRTLTAEGTAAGGGTLFPFKGALYGKPGYSEFSTPKVDEEYVYALTEGSGMTLMLSQQDTGLTVERKNNTSVSGQDIWYIAEASYHVLYDFKSGTFGASLPEGVEGMLPEDDSTYKMGDTVEAIPPEELTYYDEATHKTWIFDGYDADSKVVSEENLEEGFGSDDNLYIKFSGTWLPLEDAKVTVAPVDITVYMGGNDGADGVVNGAGGIESSESLPTPGFTVKLNGETVEDLEELTFRELGTDRTWTFVPYDGKSDAVYRLEPCGTEGQDPVRVQFKDGDKFVVSDSFNVGEHVNQTLEMSIYPGDPGDPVTSVTVTYDGYTYDVDFSAAAELTVRGTTSAPEYAEVEDEIGFTPTEGEPGLTAPDGTAYTINDGGVEVTEGSVALLFDGIIEEGADSTERAEALAERGDKELGAVGAGRERHYEFKYLDLVDRDNGNVWVRASNEVTVYWPLPEGADAETLKVLHFKGLHREMLPGSVESEIEGCDVEVIEADVTDTHVVFEIGEAGFSPFALVWEEKADTPVIVPPTPDDGPDDVVPPMLNGDDHFAYVIGYEDGTVKPNGQITRAEVATIIFRLLDPEVRDANLTTENSFTDVSEGSWYNTAVSTLVKLGIISGRSETIFDPNAPITRAEFATLFARFDESGAEAKSTFADVGTHWARESIELAAALGWINGYEDGTFRPDNRITRAEAMTMINRVLNRDPVEDDDLLPDMRSWTDNQPGTWYYFAVQEATNSHEYTRPDAHEDWTEITADPDWTRYQ